MFLTGYKMPFQPQSSVALREGLFMNEGHCVEFNMMDNACVWVDEILQSNLKDDRVLTRIYKAREAALLQQTLVNLGYDHVPSFTINHMILDA